MRNLGPEKSRAALARDAALARIGRTRRWVIAGAAALTAGFAGLVAAIAPGRSLASKSSARTEATSAPPSTRSGSPSIPRMPPPASAGDLGLQGPGQAPSAPPDDQSQPQQSAPSQPQQSTPSQPQQSAPSSPSSDPSQSAPPPVQAPGPPVVSGGS